MRLFVREVLAAASSWGRSRVAVLIRSWDVVGREAAVGGESGEAMVQRWLVMVSSCVDRVEAMMSMLSRKMAVSPERISRSEGSGIWPFRRAETRSMQACSSSGRVGAREGRVVSVLIRI